MGAGNSMMPLSPWGVVARLCFFTTFTPSTTTRNCLGYTCRTLPSRPRSSPRITRTWSPLATWSLWRAGSRSVRRARRLFLKTSGFISDHLRRERYDLHELLLAQLATDRPEDAGRAGLALVGDEHRGVLVEPDVGAVLALRLLGGPDDDGPHHLALLGAHDLLAVESVGEAAGQEDRDGLLPLVAHHDPGAELALAPRLLLGLRHAGFLSRSRRIVLMRAISRRCARNCSGFVTASVARLNVRRKRSSVRTASFCCSSSVDSSRSASGFCFAILALLPPDEPGLDR